MSKKKKAHQNYDKTTPLISFVLPDNMPQEDMQNLIVNSLLAYDEAKKKLEKQEHEKEAQEWREKIGYKDYSDRKWLPRVLLTFFNSIKTMLKILFMPKKKINGDHATSGLMKLFVILFFNVCKWVLWGVFIAAVLSYPVSLIFHNYHTIYPAFYPSCIEIGVIAFILAQLFRMATIEVEKMKDHNYVVDIFAAVAAVVAIILSFVIR